MTHNELLAEIDEPNPAAVYATQLVTELAKQKENYLITASEKVGINPQIVVEQDALIKKLKAQLRAVVELHTVGNGEASRCEACYMGFDCPTIQAIEEELG